MLVLSRKESEKIMLGDSVVLTIVRVSGDRVRLGIEAPSDMLILRMELDPTEHHEITQKATNEKRQQKVA
jgi:carbon storage regulator